MTAPIVYILAPCYNEEEVLPETARQLTDLMGRLIDGGQISPRSRITLVDDRSRDATWQVIEKLHRENPLVEGLRLAHNEGHQRALWAGMMTVRQEADAVITIDADLQDDINAIPEFIQAYKEGCDVVYGVRSHRDTDTPFKRKSAHLFYGLMNALGVEMVKDHADYRLLSRRALDTLSQYKEVNLFLRGMIPLVGLHQKQVYYQRKPRFAGKSKYPLNRMIAFAVEGITSFSIRPLRLAFLLGALFAVIGAVMAVWAVVDHFMGHTVAGWASIMVSIWIIGGVQLMALGLIGEYIGKIYTEVKRRPRYIVDERLTHQEEGA